jgi:molybdopterin molybdotransferase
MLPDGTDAVVMVEKTQRLSAQEVEVLSPVAVGENVIQIGEDIAQFTQILPAGHRIRPQDIGGLLAVGILEVTVIKPPRVAILSCGDELVLPDEIPGLGQVRDINAYTLAALVESLGGEPLIMGIAQDHWESYHSLAHQGFARADILILTAGSSLSTRDLTRQVIDSLGEPGVLQHGLAVKPGKPTLLAVCENKPVIGLPGNPVSALSVADQIITPIIERFMGLNPPWQATLSAVLATNIASTTGRTDRIPVRLYEKDGQMMAEPVFGKSNLIYTLVNADGWIEIPLNSNGLRAGTVVPVTLYH